MKKIFLFCTVLALSMPVWAESCANGAGTVVYGNDKQNNDGKGTAYCMSNISMNWWSAVAWCKSLGENAHLIDLTTECNKTTGDVACPNLKLGSGPWCWTLSVPSSSTAYFVILSSGELNGYYGRRYDGSAALCVGY